MTLNISLSHSYHRLLNHLRVKDNPEKLYLNIQMHSNAYFKFFLIILQPLFL